MRKRYKVTGTRPYRDKLPGEEFSASLPPAVERRAVERGSLRVIDSGKSKKKKGD